MSHPSFLVFLNIIEIIFQLFTFKYQDSPYIYKYCIYIKIVAFIINKNDRVTICHPTYYEISKAPVFQFPNNIFGCSIYR